MSNCANAVFGGVFGGVEKRNEKDFFLGGGGEEEEKNLRVAVVMLRRRCFGLILGWGAFQKAHTGN